MSFNICGDCFSANTRQPLVLEGEAAAKACRSVITTMLNELPEEAHSIEVLDYILEMSKETLHSLPIKL